MNVLSRNICTVLLSLCLAAGLGGCGNNSRAPIEDRYTSSSPASPSYVVQRADTLYTIAFRYGLDYRKVAAADAIAPPYTIYPGQKLALREADPGAAVSPPAPASTLPSPPLRGTPVPSAVSSSGTSGSTNAAPPIRKPQPVLPGTAAPPPGPVAVAPRPAPAAPAVVVGGVVKSWRWPSSGTVTRTYSASVHKGIDIGGKRGDPIYAVADGVVVYAGTGIVGFGELLIVKHNDTYLSAYGHNDRLLVRENEAVRAGQKIAEKGSSGTDTVKLHFEIRVEGKPIDPLKLLPRR